MPPLLPCPTAASEALRVIKEAKALEAAGCFSIVLECVPEVVAAAVTREIGIPTIGIGAGGGTSGQVGRADAGRGQGQALATGLMEGNSARRGIMLQLCQAWHHAAPRILAAITPRIAASGLSIPSLHGFLPLLPWPGAGVPRPAGHDAAPAPRQGDTQVLQAVQRGGAHHSGGEGVHALNRS